MINVEAKKYKVNVDSCIYKIILNDEKINSDIIDTIDNSKDEQNYNTNVKAHMTHWRMQKYKGFVELKNTIDKIVEQIVFEKIKIKNSLSSLFLREMWGLKYKSNDYTVKHNHWPAILSFAYYPNSVNNSSLFFDDLNLEIHIEKGLLLIFDGFLEHSVKNLQIENYRYCVSGNYF